MSWFKRKEKGIQTATEDKKDFPEGLWYKTPTGKIVGTDELERNVWVSPEDDFHVRIGSAEYFQIIQFGRAWVDLLNSSPHCFLFRSSHHLASCGDIQRPPGTGII